MADYQAEIKKIRARGGTVLFTHILYGPVVTGGVFVVKGAAGKFYVQVNSDGARTEFSTREQATSFAMATGASLDQQNKSANQTAAVGVMGPMPATPVTPAQATAVPLVRTNVLPSGVIGNNISSDHPKASAEPATKHPAAGDSVADKKSDRAAERAAKAAADAQKKAAADAAHEAKKQAAAQAAADKAQQRAEQKSQADAAKAAKKLAQQQAKAAKSANDAAIKVAKAQAKSAQQAATKKIKAVNGTIKVTQAQLTGLVRNLVATGDAAVTAQAKATRQKRLLIGGGVLAGVGLLAWRFGWI